MKQKEKRGPQALEKPTVPKKNASEIPNNLMIFSDKNKLYVHHSLKCKCKENLQCSHCPSTNRSQKRGSKKSVSIEI